MNTTQLLELCARVQIQTLSASNISANPKSVLFTIIYVRFNFFAFLTD